MHTTVAIQGHAASFHEIAAQKFFESVTSRPCDTFQDVFDSIVADKTTHGVVAIENSLYGSINEVYDLLLRHSVRIVGEVYLRIEQCLIGIPGVVVTDIKEVYSHPVALAQCETYLDSTLPTAERLEHHDTAASVADVKRWNDPTKAAIASGAAAALHGMEVLARGIETNSQNYTRFVVLSKNPVVTQPNKTSLILRTNHKPGALHAALGVFARRDMNLSKLQSRPIVGHAWQYMFYIDITCSAEDTQLSDAIAELETQQCTVTILGSYQAGDNQVVVAS